MDPSEENDLIHLLNKSSSMCSLAGWALEAINYGSSPPESESLKMELFEGITYILETIRKTLGYIKGRIDNQTPLC